MRWKMIDEIVECDPGKKIKTIRTFSQSEEFFQDHFRNYPILPGVLQIELIAAAGGCCMKCEDISLAPVLASVKGAKFYDLIKPESLCEIEVELIQKTDSYARSKGVITVDRKKKCKAEILYGFLPKEMAQGIRPDPVVLSWLERNQP